MITWDQALIDCQDMASDYSATSQVFFKRLLNTGYKRILSVFMRQQTEKTITGQTVASQQYYQFPYDLVRMKTITVTSGTTVYPLVEIESQEEWNSLNISNNTSSTIAQYFFVRPRFGVNGGDVGLWPIPSASGTSLTMVYEATDKDLSQTAYTTGSVTVAIGGTTVIGSGTTFTSQMVGRYFNITDTSGQGDGLYYRIVSYNSATSLVLENYYQGLSANGLSYQIAEMFALPEDMQIIPVYYAMWHYYLLKKNKDLTQYFQQMYNSEMLQAKNTYNKKTDSNIINHGASSAFFNRQYPSYFPSGGINS